MKTLRIIMLLLVALPAHRAFADGPAFPVRCYPFDLHAYNLDTAPASYTSHQNKALSFIDCSTGALVVQLYNDDELNALKWDALDILKAVKNGLTFSQAITLWAQAQPIRENTPEEQAFQDSLIRKYLPPAKVCTITKQSATVLDRQVYKAVSTTGTASGALTGVRSPAGTVVPCGSRIGGYFSVANTKDTLGRVIPAGFAAGAQQ
jgi:hypothetical protein